MEKAIGEVDYCTDHGHQEERPENAAGRWMENDCCYSKSPWRLQECSFDKLQRRARQREHEKEWGNRRQEREGARESC